MGVSTGVGDTMKHIALYDLSGAWWRAWHGYKDRVAVDKVKAAIAAEAAAVDELIVCLDSAASWRKDRWSGYKANRTAKDEMAVELMGQLVGDLGWTYKTAISPSYEADDVMATLAKARADAGDQVTIISADKDMLQCLRAGVSVKNTAVRPVEIVARESLGKTHGIKPHQVPDWLALVGDAADNIPGVRGVGPVKAAQWLSNWGSLSGVIEAAMMKDLTGKAAEALLHDVNNGDPPLAVAHELATLMVIPEDELIITTPKEKKEAPTVASDTDVTIDAEADLVSAPEDTIIPYMPVAVGMALNLPNGVAVASSLSLDQYAPAMVAAQSQFSPIVNDSKNPHFRSTYASLKAVKAAIMPALNAAGITVQQMAAAEHVYTVFMHKSAQWVSSRTPIVKSGKVGPQAYGASLTYAKRQALMATAGVASEDDDGNSAYDGGR